MPKYAINSRGLLNLLKSTISERFNIPETHLFLNTADKDDEGSFYLTVTGSSLEQGDDGSTGRGNRIMGVIAPFRPQSLEATAGKNPNAHVGNIYNIWAAIIAQNIYKVYQKILKMKKV